MYPSSKQPKTQHAKPTEMESARLYSGFTNPQGGSSPSPQNNTRNQPTRARIHAWTTWTSCLLWVTLLALCVLGAIQTHFLGKVSDLHEFSNLVVTETHYFTDTVTATRYLATRVETSTKIVLVSASATGDVVIEEKYDNLEETKMEFAALETRNGMNMVAASTKVDKRDEKGSAKTTVQTVYTA